ncbi:MAG: hypothetical protein IKH26_00525 [Bacteroidaceae bacterium]|nr:hypothetical protein [Bacteroidaceae bacterium]
MKKADSSTLLYKGSEYIALFLSSFCLLIMIVPTHNMMRHILLYAMFMFVVMRHPLHLRGLWTLSKSSVFFSLLAFALGVWRFSRIWKYNVSVLLPSLNEHAQLIAALIALILAFLGSFFLASLIDAFIEHLGNNKDRLNSTELSLGTENQKNIKRNDIIICLLMAVAVITICNMCSPLYPTNPWYSAAIYHTIGKSLWSGKMLYLDLYDHKGPIIFLIHSLATLISYRSFFGVYLLLIPFAFFFFMYSRKILRFFTEKTIDPWFPVVGIGVYTVSFYWWGDSAEEIFLPFMAYSIYATLLISKNQDVSLRTKGFCIGICVGVILWLKFNLLLFWGSLFLFLYFDLKHQKRIADFSLVMKHAFWGCIAITSPIVLLFLVTGAFPAMIDVYFKDNILVYFISKLNNDSEHSSYMYSQFYQLKKHLSEGFPLFIMLLVGLCALWKKDKKVFSLFLMLELVLMLSIFVKPDGFTYYSLILGVFVPISVLPLSNIHLNLQKYSNKMKRIIVVSVSVVGGWLMLIGSDNYKYLSMPKEDYVQFRFAEKVMKDENQTLLDYHSFDYGVYALTGTVPVNRFFCNYNTDNPEKFENQEKVVRNREVQFLITANFSDSIQGYCIVDSMKDVFYDTLCFLYKREDDK